MDWWRSPTSNIPPRLLCEATGGFAHRTDEHIWLVVLDDGNQVCIVIAFPRLWYGDVSKPWHLVNIKIAGKWMFIPLKMVLIGIDPYPYLWWDQMEIRWNRWWNRSWSQAWQQLFKPLRFCSGGWVDEIMDEVEQWQWQMNIPSGNLLHSYWKWP